MLELLKLLKKLQSESSSLSANFVKPCWSLPSFQSWGCCMHCMYIYSWESMDAWNKNICRWSIQKKKKRKQDVAQVLLVQEIELIIFYFIFAGHMQIFWNIVTIRCCVTSCHFHIIQSFFFFSPSKKPAWFLSWAMPTNLCVVIHPIYLFCSWVVLWKKKKLCHV